MTYVNPFIAAMRPVRSRAGDGIVVTCDTEDCEFERSSTSDLAILDFVFDHDHSVGTVRTDDGRFVRKIHHEERPWVR